jgi:hypothetical protein
MLHRPSIAVVEFTTESMAVITVLLTSVTGALVVVWKLLLAAKESQIARLDADLASWKQMALESQDVLDVLRNRERVKAGKPPMPALAPVVPESSSPPTKEQIAAGEVATARARLTAATLEFGLPVRASVGKAAAAALFGSDPTDKNYGGP